MTPPGLAAVLASLVALTVPPTAAAEETGGVNWPSFRGPSAAGVAEGYPTPTAWDAEKMEQIRWKTPVPGLGHSSPVIWGDRLLVTTAVSGESDPRLKVGLYGNIEPVTEDTVYSWRLLCLSRTTGDLLWERTACEGVPKVKRHPKSTHANPTPATNGRQVVAFFGSEGLYCYDADGKLLWKKDLGVLDSGYYVVPQAQWAFGSSPIIHGDRVIVQCDVQRNSFLAALDIRDGSEVWRTPRDEVPTWSTPTVHVSPERAQIIVNGYKHIGGYDLATGQELWKLAGGGDIPVPTPVAGHGLVFITNAHGMMAPIYALRLNAAGLVSVRKSDEPNPHVAWWLPRDGVYMQTPLVYGDHLYACKDNGVLSCYEAATGKRLYRQRLGGGSTAFTASPVAADGKVYFTSETGDVYVVKAGPEFELLATNPLGEICMATPAISEGTLFFRTRHHLVAVGHGDAESAAGGGR